MAGFDGIEAFHLDENFLDVVGECFTKDHVHDVEHFARKYKLETLRDMLRPEVQGVIDRRDVRNVLPKSNYLM